jgi:hypothetical protein
MLTYIITFRLQIEADNEVDAELKFYELSLTQIRGLTTHVEFVTAEKL